MKERTKLRGKLTYANVMVTILAVAVLGSGIAYGAGHLGKNSVGTKQLKKNAVTGAKVKNQSLTGEDIILSKLGTVPNASHASVADSANSIPPAEPTHLVGAPGEPTFENGSANLGALGSLRLQPVGFYKDHEGIVHLQGAVKIGGAPGVIFTLPPGYRPASGTALLFEPINEGSVFVLGGNTTAEGKVLDGAVLGGPGKTTSLDGILFRAES
jgi:hypothetical protein